MNKKCLKSPFSRNLKSRRDNHADNYMKTRGQGEVQRTRRKQEKFLEEAIFELMKLRRMARIRHVMTNRGESLQTEGMAQTQKVKSYNV